MNYTNKLKLANPTNKLKLAKVIPIHKKDNVTDFANYRPISILPALSKIFERVIYNQTHDYFQSNNLYFNSQYGFRKQHSTELALLEVIDRITQQLDNKITPINIFLDLSKAFDTLDPDVLSLPVWAGGSRFWHPSPVLPRGRRNLPLLKLSPVFFNFMPKFYIGE